MTDEHFTRLTFDIDPDDWPLLEPIVLQDGIATFADQLASLQNPEAGLARDAEFLRALALEETYYGGRSSRIYPFVCVLPTAQNPPTARDILTAVQARHFRSQHIASLDETTIPFPGYHPYTENDEIHTDFAEQGIFSHEEGVSESSGAHGALKDYVADQRLWYVLLHATPRPFEGRLYSEYVVLFALGKSPTGNRCVGVVTHQLCHNYCD